MSRAFFEDAAEALRGFLPHAYRDFHSATGSRNLKIWYASWHEHYEVQAISRAALRAAGIKRPGEAFEVGFHAEHPRVDHNDEVIERLGTNERVWRKSLGRAPEAGDFIGRREIRGRWRRVSELWDDASSDNDGAVIEAAERLGEYIAALEPFLRRTPGSKCACWNTQNKASVPG